MTLYGKQLTAHCNLIINVKGNDLILISLVSDRSGSTANHGVSKLNKLHGSESKRHFSSNSITRGTSECSFHAGSSYGKQRHCTR